jgi:antitoxin HigA-1
MIRKKMEPLHPGEVLQREFLEPLGLSQNKLAIAIRVPARRINEIILGKRRITANTALRLARYFKMTPEFWLGLQMDYDLDLEQGQFESEIASKIKPMVASG